MPANNTRMQTPRGIPCLVGHLFVLFQLSPYNQLRVSTTYHTSACSVYSYRLYVDKQVFSYVVYVCWRHSMLQGYLVCTSHTLVVDLLRMVLGMYMYTILSQASAHTCVKYAYRVYVNVPLPAGKVWKHAPQKNIVKLEAPISFLRLI